jgi:hypothetical protein
MHLDGAFVDGDWQERDVPLGAAAALTGKPFEVSAAIKDINAANNRLSLRVHISSMSDPIDIVHDGGAGDAALYSIVVLFR